MIYLQLFFSFLQVGLFSVGGGYAAMPLIQYQVVDLNRWLTAKELSDLVTIAEMTPGPIAVNAATFIGTRFAGLPGALTATFGAILPSIIIVSLLFHLYARCREMPLMQSVLSALRPVVVALILSAMLSILRVALFSDAAISLDALDALNLALFAAALFALRRLRLSPILTMAICGALRLLASLLLPGI